MGPVPRSAIPLVAAMLALGGCGGDDGGETRPGAPLGGATTTDTPPPARAPEQPTESRAPEREPRERTPRSLAGCIREQPGVSDVLVKGDDSEDTRFFSELAPGGADVLGVTVEGEPGEVTVAVFDSAGAAGRAAPDAGGGSAVTVRAVGSAVVVGPPGAETGPIEDCLRATGYG